MYIGKSLRGPNFTGFMHGSLANQENKTREIIYTLCMYYRNNTHLQNKNHKMLEVHT